MDLSNLSHDLKVPLTSIKGYLQLILETYGNSIESNLTSTIKNVLNQSTILENKIVEYLDNFEINVEARDSDQNIEYDILLVEDDQETVNLLKSYFESMNITCKGVLSGFKGLKELKGYKPRLILLDIILPDINGYEILKRIKADNTLKNIPVFILTAIPSIEVEKKALDLDAKGTISKPFNLTDFDVIYKYVNKK